MNLTSGARRLRRFIIRWLKAFEQGSGVNAALQFRVSMRECFRGILHEPAAAGSSTPATVQSSQVHGPDGGSKIMEAPLEPRSSGRESAPSSFWAKSAPTHVGCSSSEVQCAKSLVEIASEALFDIPPIPEEFLRTHETRLVTRTDSLRFLLRRRHVGYGRPGATRGEHHAHESARPAATIRLHPRQCFSGIEPNPASLPRLTSERNQSFVRSRKRRKADSLQGHHSRDAWLTSSY